MKLSGKTSKGTAFGVMNAVIANEYATIESKSVDPLTGLEQTKKDEYLIEPLTNFFVSRMKQDLTKDSNLGVMLTSVNRDEDVSAYDDTTTRGGPVIARRPGTFCWISLWTDGRKTVSGGMHIEGSRADEGLDRNLGYYFGMGIKPASNIQINMGPSYRTDHNTYQWVKNVEDDTGTHYVFGKYNGRVIDLTIRASIFFNPEMSFQFYVQPFLAVGNYENFTELARPRSYEFKPYTDADFNPDFVSRSLRSNAVFRWEYNPGSVLFLVWSQSRGAFMEINDPMLNAYENFRGSVTDDGQNVFLVKLSYWLGM